MNPAAVSPLLCLSPPYKLYKCSSTLRSLLLYGRRPWQHFCTWQPVYIYKRLFWIRLYYIRPAFLANSNEEVSTAAATIEIFLNCAAGIFFFLMSWCCWLLRIYIHVWLVSRQPTFIPSQNSRLLCCSFPRRQSASRSTH